MNLIDTILIAFATVAFVIGVHQTFYYPLASTYWIFMISLLIVMYMRHRKTKEREAQTKKNEDIKKKKK